ncbi:MAG: hypothetical protein M5R42_02680 [Rhodocyclaceae bacterium]|nr:hypothetical protein [Rhodocyclaceae bacterium]
MAGMHEDMNGSAVALGLMQALIERNMPLSIDAWLPIAQNHLSPGAYKQNDIVTALDGTTIEVVHTDAEGRMVLADALTLATRGTGKTGGKPDLVVDFATLTGSMGYALGSRYSGVFAATSELARLAVTAGEASGERVCVFPLDADYEAGLESKVADIKQCTLDGEADHILAARFLKRFTHDSPWVHMDLSSSSCSSGLVRWAPTSPPWRRLGGGVFRAMACHARRVACATRTEGKIACSFREMGIRHG